MKHLTNEIEPIYTAIGLSIRQHRIAAGLTQEDLGCAMKIGRTSLVNIEGGRQRISVQDILNAAQALGVELVELIPFSSASHCDRDALLQLKIENSLLKERLAKFEKVKTALVRMAKLCQQDD